MGTSLHPSAPVVDGVAPSAAFVGRQPILDRDLGTHAYELLFRRDRSATDAEVVDGGTATARVLVNAVTEIGLDQLVGSRLAFVNLTEHFLAEPDLLALLPADRVVLEVLEHVEPTAEVLSGLGELRDRGYRIAVDDFVYRAELEPLLALADVVKYDLAQQSWSDLRGRIRADHAAGRQVVVERVEDANDHRAAVSAGADLLQGYFFAKPTTVGGSSLPPSRLALLHLLARVNDPDSTLDEIVEALAQDVAMSVKTLRFVNSAATGVTTEVESIGHAATLLGRDTLRSWTSLTLMASLDDAPSELTTLALTRARTAEALARLEGHPSPSACYTAGMLSLLDAMTGTDMEALLAALPLRADIRAALLGGDNPIASVLQRAVDLERGRLADGVGSGVLHAHQQAMTWATDLLVRSGSDRRRDGQRGGR